MSGPYSYNNADGSRFFQNADGSRFYDPGTSGKGRKWYESPDGVRHYMDEPQHQPEPQWEEEPEWEENSDWQEESEYEEESGWQEEAQWEEEAWNPSGSSVEIDYESDVTAPIYAGD